MESFIHREEDYALRIIIFLATTGKMVKIKDICSSLYLSRPMVVKIVNRLKSCGFLITKTGKEGGLTVTPKVYDASVYDILVCMGFNSRMNQCLSPSIGCRLMPICRANLLFSEIQADVENKLKNAKIKEFLYTADSREAFSLKTQEV